MVINATSLHTNTEECSLTRPGRRRPRLGEGKGKAAMKFSNFLFPDCRDPGRDGVVIDETLREAWLSDELGVDVIWLAEHHFDGICAMWTRSALPAH